jgi:uncharacterized alpha/beta hydrolase family protein
MVTLNGAAPKLNASACSDYADPSNVTAATVTLVENTHGYQFGFPITCSATSFSFSESIFPGTYTATVAGNDGTIDDLNVLLSNLPDRSYVANSSLVVQSNTSGVVLDVPTENVAGTVTLNGAAPKLNASACSDYADPSNVTAATVTLVENTHGYQFAFPITCGATSFSFSESIFPGTYTATVAGNDGTIDDLNVLLSNLPDRAYVANSSLVVQSNTSGVILDVPTVDVAGTVTLNGAAPKLNASACSDYADPSNVTAATVTLVENTYHYQFGFPITCSATSFSFSGSIFPGTYTATVAGNDGTIDDLNVLLSNLPDRSYVAAAGIVIPP